MTIVDLILCQKWGPKNVKSLTVVSQPTTECLMLNYAKFCRW